MPGYKTCVLLVLFIAFVSPGCSSAKNSRYKGSAENTIVEKDSAEWDFGKVKAGRKPEHIFTFRNKSDKLLIIKELSSSCGCTAAIISTTRIPPGSSAQIRVTFDTAGYEGKIRQDVYMHTDDPETPFVTFTIHAEVLRE